MLYCDTRSFGLTDTAKSSSSRLNDLTPVFLCEKSYKLYIVEQYNTHILGAVRSLLLPPSHKIETHTR